MSDAKVLLPVPDGVNGFHLAQKVAGIFGYWGQLLHGRELPTLELEVYDEYVIMPDGTGKKIKKARCYAVFKDPKDAMLCKLALE